MNDDNPFAANKFEPSSGERELHRVTSVLEGIAAGFTPGSEEEQAIRDAALACHAVWSSQLMLKSFAKLKTLDGTLTPSLRENLRTKGIDVDALEAEAARIEALADAMLSDDDSGSAPAKLH